MKFGMMIHFDIINNLKSVAINKNISNMAHKSKISANVDVKYKYYYEELVNFIIKAWNFVMRYFDVTNNSRSAAT